MNIQFQTINPAYPRPAASQNRRVPLNGKVRGDYDTVTISGTQSSQEDGFARILSRRAVSQLASGAPSARVQELGRQVADGSYRPDADQIAGRLLGLN